MIIILAIGAILAFGALVSSSATLGAASLPFILVGWWGIWRASKR